MRFSPWPGVCSGGTASVYAPVQADSAAGCAVGEPAVTRVSLGLSTPVGNRQQRPGRWQWDKALPVRPSAQVVNQETVLKAEFRVSCLLVPW